MNSGGEHHFDSAAIGRQFERLIELFRFKRFFKNHRIEIIIDNARTHTTRAYSLQGFGKSIGTRCPVNYIKYDDVNGVKQLINTHLTSGQHQGKSKGLL
jgi:hypothetical protein